MANILDDLPLEHAFTPGKTNLYEGVEDGGRGGQELARQVRHPAGGQRRRHLARQGNPRAAGRLWRQLGLGVGNPYHGLYIDGHSSRQDGDSLRQLALRLGGQYFDTNVRHVPSADLVAVDRWLPLSQKSDAGLREWAIGSTLGGAAVLAALCVALSLAGGFRGFPQARRGTAVGNYGTNGTSENYASHNSHYSHHSRGELI